MIAQGRIIRVAYNGLMSKMDRERIRQIRLRRMNVLFLRLQKSHALGVLRFFKRGSMFETSASSPEDMFPYCVKNRSAAIRCRIFGYVCQGPLEQAMTNNRSDICTFDDGAP
jgi:hypothetical protein